MTLDLLDVLKKFSDKNNPITQKEIIEKLETNDTGYGYEKVRRQTVQSNLEKIIAHYELDGSNLIRLAAEDDYYKDRVEYNDNEKRRITNIYYQHQLNDSELLLIIDSILFSKQIPVDDRYRLIEKLESFTSNKFKSRKGNIASISSANRKEKKLEDKALFTNITRLDKAISQFKKVSFKYFSYKVQGRDIDFQARKKF